jgi:hypothetical protein
MNGRIERRDARLELAINSEPNYATVDFLFDEDRRRKLFRRWLRRLFLIAVSAGVFAWLLHRGGLR